MPVDAIVGYDGSPGASAAIAAGALLFPGAHGWTTYLWVPPFASDKVRRRLCPMARDANELAEMVEREGECEAQRIVGMGVTLARAAGWHAERLLRRTWGPEGLRIAQAVDDVQADLVVVGARGFGGTQAVLGSVSDMVLHYLPPAGGRGTASDAVSRVRSARQRTDPRRLGRLERCRYGVGGGQAAVPAARCVADSRRRRPSARTAGRSLGSGSRRRASVDRQPRSWFACPCRLGSTGGGRRRPQCGSGGRRIARTLRCSGRRAGQRSRGNRAPLPSTGDGRPGRVGGRLRIVIGRPGPAAVPRPPPAL
ncbi:hypothetical protein LAUMK142_00726 [Mycobacterium pseudokansasii]|uniref:UspA domain-containing protein n=1 Tax=Mycobacterium pseudokansasii TaxID=2341080 RepID=A0A498QL08_9MYCO|nr:hypothetical protein LAUMK142_00726 [Mycobacterium pseudokansasii]